MTKKKKNKLKKFVKNMDWKSKLIDLFIVIIGISIAFQLDNWSERTKANREAKEFMNSFRSENDSNQKELEEALSYAKLSKLHIDSLFLLLQDKVYISDRLQKHYPYMLGRSSYIAQTTTLENIKASGKFDLIKDNKLRRCIVDTYQAHGRSQNMEKHLSEYLDKYITPYFFEHFRMLKLHPLSKRYAKEVYFENMLVGFSALLSQQISAYEANLKEIVRLNGLLEAGQSVQK